MFDVHRPTLLGILALLFWSSTIPVARSVTEAVGPFTAGASIYALGGLLVITFRYFGAGQPVFFFKFPPKYLYGCGLLFIIYMATLYTAIYQAADRSQLLEVGLINYLWPIFVVLFSVPLLGNKANLLLVPGVIIALTGIILVTNQGRESVVSDFGSNIIANPSAYSLALIAAISWGLYSNLSKRWGNKDSHGAVGFFMLGNAVVLFLLQIFFEIESNWSMKTFLEVLFVSVAASLGYVFWDIGMRKGNFTLISITSYFTPLVSTVIGSLYLDVKTDIRLWIGCLLLLLGAYLSKCAVRENA